MLFYYSSLFFFFNDTATTEIYTLSLHDALPILSCSTGIIWERGSHNTCMNAPFGLLNVILTVVDRKSTRLNSSHPSISYAVFCLKKKKKKNTKYNKLKI